MKVLDPKVTEDISAGVLIDLDLGAGPAGYREKKGCYAVDTGAYDGVSIQADFNEPLDLIPDDSVRSVHSSHCFEHIANLDLLMREVHRILHPQGKAEIIVPHFSNPYGYSDPTHVRFFGLYSMFYFSDGADNRYRHKVPAFYTEFKFRIESIHIGLLRRPWFEKILLPFLPRLINRSPFAQEIYERKLCNFFPAEEIYYDLRPIK